MDLVGRKMSSRKLLKAVWLRNGHAASLGVKKILPNFIYNIYTIEILTIRMTAVLTGIPGFGKTLVQPVLVMFKF